VLKALLSRWYIAQGIDVMLKQCSGDRCCAEVQLWGCVAYLHFLPHKLKYCSRWGKDPEGAKAFQSKPFLIKQKQSCPRKHTPH